MSTPSCARCQDCGTVCENHPERPWGALCCQAGQDGLCEHGWCGCGAGDPCPLCSPYAAQIRADRNRWYRSGPNAEERRLLRMVRRLRLPRHWGSDGPSVLRSMRRRRR